jgi:hypothetical protein
MTHELSELNEYTGMFCAGCLLALFFCLLVLGQVGTVVQQFHRDFRKVHDLAEREKWELNRLP